MMDLTKLELNKIIEDEFGRPSGVLAINKPAGITSHDVVDKVRKKLGTKKVGHAGTLDPFADGILIILVGKATKLSDRFLGQDKEYIATMLIGASTKTGDPEEEIEIEKAKNIQKEDVEEVLKTFQPSYRQFVPIYSSVKVKGEKLRQLACKYDKFVIEENKDAKIAKFYNDQELKKEIEIPSKEVKIYEAELMKFEQVKKDDLKEFKIVGSEKKSLLYTAKVRILCSKGTYIRQISMDLGEKLGTGAMLLQLSRTKIGKIGMEDTEDL